MSIRYLKLLIYSLGKRRIFSKNHLQISPKVFVNTHENTFNTYFHSFIEKENHLCGQLLLHPPFKPKRLIHLCPDGSIQVLSAIDDQNSQDHHQQYHLNYSNSATSIFFFQKKNSIVKLFLDESPLALEYETIAVDSQTDFNDRAIAEPTQARIKYDNLLEDSSIEIDFEEGDPVIKVDLELDDEITESHSENEENSFPEIFFKRIITPKRNHSSCSTLSSQGAIYGF